MGIIQNALNQMLGTVSVAARLSPGYETKQELYKLGKQEKMLGLQQELLPSDAKEQQKEILEKRAEIAQKQFELNPTKKSMNKATSARTSADEFSVARPTADPDKIRQEQANIKAAEKQERKRAQKRNFMNYLGNLKTSLGGKVSELPVDMQKIIAKQYSKQERKKLMDTIDKEKKDGNK